MLNFALVGCGRIAKRHAQLLGGNQIKHARLVGVCDVVAERAAHIASECGTSYFKDMHAMLRSVDVDVVVVTTESGRHAQHVIALAPYGKHIVVEKPMALTLEDADAMIGACEASKVKLFVVKQNRFNWAVMKLREALNAERFGKVVLGTVRVRWCREQSYYDQDAWRGTWALDGGVLANQAIHHIDLLVSMVGPVDSVFAYASTALVRIETEDTAVACLRFANGALGVIEATTAARPNDLEASISILGELGAVQIGGLAVNRIDAWNFTAAVDGDDAIKNRPTTHPLSVYGEGHRAYYEHVVDCILNDKEPLIDGVEGRRSLELINAIYKSIETGKEVMLKDDSRCYRQTFRSLPPSLSWRGG